MCGLVGIAGDVDHKSFRMFRDMLVFDTIRGFDSTGVCKVDLQDNIIIEKDIGPPQMLWDWVAKSKIFTSKGTHNGVLPKVLLGHNRAATVGEVNFENAHPFEYGGIIGAHNGTLTGRGWRLEGDHNLIDSQRVFKHISEKGIDDCWAKLDGAAALSFYDKKAETINLIRNNQRPLFITSTADKKLLIWASDYGFFTLAARISGIELLKNKEGITTYKELKPNFLYPFKIKPNGFDVLEERELSPFVTKVGIHHNQNSGNNSGSASKTGKNKKEQTDFNNKFWAKGTLKGEKDTRGIEFYLFAEGTRGTGNDRERYLLARITEGVHKDKEVKIFPRTGASYSTLRNWVGTKKVYLSKARMREQVSTTNGVNTLISFCISGDCIETVPGKYHRNEVVESVTNVPEVKKEKSNIISLFPVFGNISVPLDEWKRCMDKIGFCCTTCGDPVDKDDAHELLWVRTDTALCKNCQEDPYIMNVIGM